MILDGRTILAFEFENSNEENGLSEGDSERDEKVEGPAG